MYVLQVAFTGDYEPPLVYGPFDSVEEAQKYAENYRSRQGLPVEATPENNEEWTAAGWYFGVFPLLKEDLTNTHPSDDPAPWSASQ